jgi:hypothetical protein
MPRRVAGFDSLPDVILYPTGGGPVPHCVWARVCACGCMGARAGAWVRAYGRVLVRACAWERVRACQCVDVCLGMRACAGVCPRAQELRVCVCACLHATATAQLSDGLCMCVPKLQWHAEPRTRVRARAAVRSRKHARGDAERCFGGHRVLSGTAQGRR